MELLVLRPDPEQESSASRFEVVVIASEIWAAEKSERSEICVLIMKKKTRFPFIFAPFFLLGLKSGVGDISGATEIFSILNNAFPKTMRLSKSNAFSKALC